MQRINSLNDEKLWPIARGSFIQWDLTAAWGDEEWQKEFSYMREVGMTYLVIIASTTKDNKIRTIYPSNIYKATMEKEEKDILDLCLRNAEVSGIKVFIGPNFNTKWWKKSTNDIRWLYGEMEKGNVIAGEIYKNYHEKYPNAFYGWYWSYEVDNMNFTTLKHFEILSEAVNINRKFLKDLDSSMCFMLSPFMNSKYSAPEEYVNNWERFFQNTDLQKGDIFCPQDSIGAHGIKMNELDKWFSAFRKAVDKKPGLLFWANTENFDVSDWTSACLDRFTKQMKIESKYVDNIICFSYNHYYSPNNIDSGFHKTYLAYVETGILENELPSAPKKISITRLRTRGYYTITWKEATDNIGICGYVVYRKGLEIFKTSVKRKYGGKDGIVYEYFDKPPLSFKEYEYDVKAFDFAGNVSE